MKFAEVQFTLGVAEHTLRAECENKFLGSVLELSLDGVSLTMVQNVKKYSFYRISLDSTVLTVFVRISSRGIPSLELIVDGTALSSGKTEEAFLEETAAAVSKNGKAFALKNALLYFVLFTVAGLLMGVLRFGGFSLRAVLVGLLCGAVITVLFLIWDLIDLHFDLKHLKESHVSPAEFLFSDAEAIGEESEGDGSVDPDSVEIPEDSVSFYDRLREDEEAEEASEAETSETEEAEKEETPADAPEKPEGK